MSLTSRVINNAIQSFVETPVAAPQYYDLNDDDYLAQYDAADTKNIFGLRFFLFGHF